MCSALAAGAASLFAPAALGADRHAQGQGHRPRRQAGRGRADRHRIRRGVNRKFEVKTDRRGEFIQIGLPAGQLQGHRHRRQARQRRRSTRVSLSKPARSNSTSPRAPPAGSGGRREGRRAEEVVRRRRRGVSRRKDFDTRHREVQRGRSAAPSCFDCYYNIGYAYSQKKDDKQAEAAWLKALELKADYSRSAERPGDALQQPEAVRRSGGDERQGGGSAGGGGGAATPTRSTTRASSSGTRARSPRPR